MKKKTDYRRDAKVLFYDLEVSPRQAWVYDFYETNVIEEIRPQYLLAVSWKWLGDKEAHCLTIYDESGVDRYDDTPLVTKLWNLLDEANIVCAFNGKRFDCKMANTFFMRHNMSPPSPYKQIDPLQTAKGKFRFGCNKLDFLGQFMKVGRKTEETYKDCWKKLLEGNDKERKQASKIMNIYCKNDSELLEKVYLKMLPWIDNHPNMALYAENECICPKCGNRSDFKVKSYRRTGVQVNAIQYQCKHCHSYVTRKLEKEERDTLKEEGRYTSVFRNVV